MSLKWRTQHKPPLPTCIGGDVTLNASPQASPCFDRRTNTFAEAAQKAARCCPDWCWTPPGLTISVRETVEMADRRTASAAVTFREKEFVLGMLRQSTTRGREDRVRPPPSTTLPRKGGGNLTRYDAVDVREWHEADMPADALQVCF